MLDTMTATKTVGALCGALLVFLLSKWAADSIYHTGSAGHGDAHDTAAIFPDVVEEVGSSAVEEVIDLAALIANADLAKGEKVFVKCKACHVVGEPTNGVGPHLVGIMDRSVASIAGFDYSNPMAALGGVWDPETLSAFLENPKRNLPGTKMTFVGLKKPQDRANLIAWLQSLQ